MKLLDNERLVQEIVSVDEGRYIGHNNHRRRRQGA